MLPPRMMGKVGHHVEPLAALSARDAELRLRGHWRGRWLYRLWGHRHGLRSPQPPRRRMQQVSRQRRPLLDHVPPLHVVPVSVPPLRQAQNLPRVGDDGVGDDQDAEWMHREVDEPESGVSAESAPPMLLPEIQAPPFCCRQYGAAQSSSDGRSAAVAKPDDAPVASHQAVEAPGLELPTHVPSAAAKSRLGGSRPSHDLDIGGPQARNVR